MDSLIGFIALMSLIYLIAGLIKPASVKTKSRKIVLLVFFAMFVLAIILASVFDKTPSDQKNVSNSKENTVNKEKWDEAQRAMEMKQAEIQKQIEASKTPEQVFEEHIKPVVADTGTTKFSYKGIEFQDAGADYPAGSKNVIISVKMVSFYNRSSYMKNTGQLSSSLFFKSFQLSMPIVGVTVWYYGDVKDHYGNVTDKIIMSQSMSKKTADKINWPNFEQEGLCDFLRSENSIDSNNVCSILADIQ